MWHSVYQTSGKTKFALYRTSRIVTLRAESHINRPLCVVFSVVLRIFPAFGTAALLLLPTQCHLTTNSSQQTLLHANDSIACLNGSINYNIQKQNRYNPRPPQNNRNTKWNILLLAVLCALFTINDLTVTACHGLICPPTILQCFPYTHLFVATPTN